MPAEQVVQIPYEPRPLQRVVGGELHRKRFGVLVCHRRWGKSVLAVNLLQQKALVCRKDRPRCAYVGPTYRQAKATVWDYMMHYAGPIPGVVFNQSELRVDYPNGGQVRIYGGDDPDALRGLYFDEVVFDEYGLHQGDIFSTVIRPELADRQGGCLFLGTPNGKNQFWDILQAARENPEWFWAVYKASETGILPVDELKAARSVMSQDEYDQEFECFPPGTMVLTSRGHLPIEQIRTGDSVLTHRTRWRPVTRVMRRTYADDVVCIQAFGTPESLKLTPDHPVLVYDRTSCTRRWVAAQKVGAGDCLIAPAWKRGTSMIDADIAALVGWFICEGSVTGNAASFSLNPQNQAEIDEVHSIITRVTGKTPGWTNGVMSLCDVTWADRLVAWCGSGAQQKRIPFDVIAGHEQMVFDVLMRGDGCTVQGGKRYAYTTISPVLAWDVFMLAAHLHRRASITIRSGGPSVILGRQVQTQTSYLLQIPHGTKVNHARQREVFPTRYGVAYRVKSVSREPYAGWVYNLSVKGDESYVAQGRAVHNCSFDASVKGAIYATELSLVRQDGRIGKVPYDPMLPVTTAWDIGISDATAIWFCQKTRSGEVRLIDYYENSGEGLPHYVKVLKEKGYAYDQHIGPHDMRVREMTSGRSRVEVARSLGVRFYIAPNLPLEDGIHAARMLLPRCWFDAKKCAPGLEVLGSYRRDWNQRISEFKATPVHDWAEHGASAFRYLALAFSDVRTDRPRRSVRLSVEGNTGWMG